MANALVFTLRMTTTNLEFLAREASDSIKPPALAGGVDGITTKLAYASDRPQLQINCSSNSIRWVRSRSQVISRMEDGQ